MAKKFKTRKKYRLTFVNENTFNAVWSVKLSRTKVWALTLVTVASLAALILIVITATPLSVLLPGYLKPAQRAEHVNNSLRVDSLARAMAVNDAYIANISRILGGEADSIDIADTAAPTSVADTLMETTDAERAFVEKWNSRERYTLSVLTPLAAETMSFHRPVATAGMDTVTERGAVTTLEMTPPRGSAVSTVTSGTVTAVWLDMAGDYAVAVQHPNNFTSVTSGLSDVTVEPGRRLQSGEALGRTDGRPLRLNLWLDGVSINPLSVL